MDQFRHCTVYRIDKPIQPGPVGKLHIFLGKIKLQFDQCGKADEFITQLFQYIRKSAADILQGMLLRCRCIGGDQVGHGLCLREIELAVQEGTLGELARLGHPGSQRYERIDDLFLDIWGTMTGDLGHIFPGIGPWRTKNRHHHFVQQFVLML